jgi:hypothetical protein
MVDTQQTRPLLGSLEKTSFHACHPLLFPSLAYKTWIDVYRRDTDFAEDSSYQAEKTTTKILDSMSLSTSSMSINDIDMYTKAHRLIIQTDEQLANLFPAFIDQF